MHSRLLYLAVGCLALCSAPSSTLAQAIPSPAQAQQMLRDDPALIGRLQKMLQSSGLTPEQIRTRLKEAGYPDSLFNAYLSDAGTTDSSRIPGNDVFAAVRAIGLADSLTVDSLMSAGRARRRAQAKLDSAFLDTLHEAIRNDTTAQAIRAMLRSREAQRLEIDSGFTVFGLDLFQKESGQFDANVAGGADPNYRFGPGDVLTLVLTGDVERSYRLTVSRDGMVLIPSVGLVGVAGQTRSQLEDILYKRLGSVQSGVRRGPGATTRFYIDVAQMGMNQVFVNGDVAHPNSYRVSRAATAMTALYLAGGPTRSGSLRNVQVRRNGETIATFDVYDYALHGDASDDIRLENDDVVFVPPRGGQVRLAGAVLRPATYEVTARQTLGDVLRMAGGLTEAADSRQIQIERIIPRTERTASGRDRSVIDVPQDAIEATRILPGDIVRVFQIARRVANRVVVNGNVWRPGVVALLPGTTLIDALRRAGGLKPDSYLGDIQITRLRPDSTRVMLRATLADTAGGSGEDFSLADGDEVTVFSMTEMRPQRFITVGGAVRRPGIRIPYREGMTLRDAILLAGGLQEGALMTGVEIARLPDKRGAGVTAVPTMVALDSSYLFERAADGHFIAPPGIVVPAAKSPPVQLEPYDVVQVKWQPEWQLQQTVALRGEVNYPGDYALVSKTERLSDIIKRAGGLTSSAYADGVVFIRRRDDVGRVGVDLPAVLRDPGHVDNLRLTDGDSIFIPKFSQVVTVRGATQSQVGVAYVEGANINYYIRSAGGATSKGDVDRAYVTQPNGKVETSRRRFLFSESHPRPQPGSTVFVPVKDPNDRRDWALIATTTTSILGSLVAIAAILRH
jgi:protein involved in polysaccharide export with SLBB domain